ncbi:MULTISPECIES: UbiA family prenyltransferase [unclassified Variovorax]|uniref:UbiA family prenyltransferase n=1 Tax=unclassified Variovorax TaxID=663243 RepID=UPI00076D1BDA|nr:MULTISPECIES: UbiA family prenyltransferase [unclassified Variovorax]KWT72590.1 integral membrane protein [Variovorax sp. WDL1]PNG58425.1 Decaprenyl-phosphate phosphoribosyltransferase [Variovorax sp. B4]PNG61785.1 Decaprenyl-phosphate phosphoribosyltransferase [Variovorax sp. B2]VTV12157.1 Decaprenyl-phosphate phosphoribosyltransferase [Variovorax sp. WDL1]
MRPLYVDLDGTLIATDSLHESLLQLVRASPASLLSLPLWLLRGKAAFKQEVAQRTAIDVQTLPYRPQVLELVRSARAAGRRTVLATASDGRLARAVASHLGLFDAVLASDGEHNLRGEGKRAAIEADAAGRGFSYAGNGHVDLAVWRGAEAAVVVSRSEPLARRAAGLTTLEAHIVPPRTPLKRYLYGVRLHQWLKNVLIFLPLMPVLHELTRPILLHAALAFVAFGLMASGIYVLNDLLDLESDRRHHRKRLRPFAAGEITAREGVAMAALLCTASLVLALALLPAAFVGVLLLYMALTSAYSLFLKRRAVVDVFALAGLYTIRVAAGTAATGLPLSFWILSFSMFIFLSLALAKRYVELTGPPPEVQRMKRDRGYQPGDATFVLCTGVAAGQMSVLLLGLYLHDEETVMRYGNPEYLWILIPLFLFWTLRVWLKAIRGALHDDPVVFAARDWVSRLAVGIAALALWVAD